MKTIFKIFVLISRSVITPSFASNGSAHNRSRSDFIGNFVTIKFDLLCSKRLNRDHSGYINYNRCSDTSLQNTEITVKRRHHKRNIDGANYTPEEVGGANNSPIKNPTVLDATVKSQAKQAAVSSLVVGENKINSVPMVGSAEEYNGAIVEELNLAVIENEFKEN